jgi:hypothetical protein
MSHFGPKVIGEEAYQEQKQLMEEGRLHFGPKVVGPYKESVHGERVVGKDETKFNDTVIEAAGAPKPLKDLTMAELETVATGLGIEFKQKTPKPVLIKKIKAWEPLDPVDPEPEPEAPEEETPEEETPEEE